MRDPSFENQGSSDRVIAPWVASSETHPNEVNKVAKLNRKAGDVLTGTTSFNWYHSSDVFHFKVSQEITLSSAGIYELSAFTMAVAGSEISHLMLEFFVVKGDGTRLSLDMKNAVRGWGTVADYYIKGEIKNIDVTANETITIGIEGRGNPGAWGHADDFALIKV